MENKLVGFLSGVDGLTGTISGGGSLSGALTIPLVADAEYYTGEYELTPSFQEQMLKTKGKTLTDDVTVVPIPVSFTENLSGGKTVYIGGDI